MREQKIMNLLQSLRYLHHSLLLEVVSIPLMLDSVTLICCSVTLYLGGTSGCLTTGTVTCKTYWINASNMRYISDGIDGGALPLRRWCFCL